MTAAGFPVAVVVSDTFGRPWRMGNTDVAIGVAGIHPMRDYRGETDPHGYELRVSVSRHCRRDSLGGGAYRGQAEHGACRHRPRLRIRIGR